MRLHRSLDGGPFPAVDLKDFGKELAFSVDEYRSRMRCAHAAMDAAGLDALLVMNPANVFYLSGFQTFAVDGAACLVAPRHGEPAIAMDPPEFGSAWISAWIKDLRGYPPGSDRPAYAASMLAEHGLDRGRIGVDDANWGQTPAFRAGLEQSLPEAEFVSAGELFIELRRLKSPAEIEHIRWAALATRAATEAAVETAAVGVTDGEIAGAAYAAMAHAGGEYPCLAPIVTSGRRSGILHSTHKRRTIERGDTVLLEIGACHQRYNAPQMRTLTVGPPADDVRRAADACIAALNAVLDALRPGAVARDVAEIGWRALTAAGDDLVFHGNFGYGIGAGFPPNWADATGFIQRDHSTVLQPGMVFHHPIAVRRLGQFGVAFSETSVITKDGCEVLTHGERVLVEC
ncbi:MAG: Xaa-Pro peptidase family protein [Chloroflexi bacterium]|nr:Xaa-Pro peptidase family protein [Chloroflexota bacterium]